MNLGTIEEPCPTFIRASLSNEEEDKYMSLLTEYRDIFAWSYKEMLGLDSKVVVHHLVIKLGYRSIKQAQRHFQVELIPQIEVEDNKCWDLCPKLIDCKYNSLIIINKVLLL